MPEAFPVLAGTGQGRLPTDAGIHTVAQGSIRIVGDMGSIKVVDLHTDNLVVAVAGDLGVARVGVFDHAIAVGNQHGALALLHGT